VLAVQHVSVLGNKMDEVLTYLMLMLQCEENIRNSSVRWLRKLI